MTAKTRNSKMAFPFLFLLRSDLIRKNRKNGKHNALFVPTVKGSATDIDPPGGGKDFLLASDLIRKNRKPDVLGTIQCTNWIIYI